MSIFELIGEFFNPGPVGSIDVEVQHKASLRAPGIVVLHAVVSSVLLALLIAFVGIPTGVLGTAACVLYVVVGTLLRPRPDYRNVGWLGGLIDHPFRISDDLNWILIVIMILLAPGRFIGAGLVNLIRLVVIAASIRRKRAIEGVKQTGSAPPVSKRRTKR